MKEVYTFFSRFLSAPGAIGSLFPSSQKLAGQIIKNIPCSSPDHGLKYLEIGAGSGSITHQLVRHLNPHDRLDIVENDPQFCSLLSQKFSHISGVTIHEISVLDFLGSGYDVIISSLPFNSFKSHLVAQILEKFESLGKKGGTLSYFEYLGLSTLKKTYLKGSSRHDYLQNQSFKDQFISKHNATMQKIWWNAPPARLICCQM